MKLKVLVRAPVLSQSGYGEHGRFVLRALRAQEDVFDIFVNPVGWGRTSWMWEETDERAWIDHLVQKTAQHTNSGGTFDVSLQVCIPNEWQKLAPVNIGCTAGIETTLISPEWVKATYGVDKIIMVSQFAKDTFTKTLYEAMNPETNEKRSIGVKGPVEVVNYPHKDIEPSDVELDLKYDFNFLAISQWSPRKNLENTIRWFIEEFYDQEIGLVVKTSTANNSHIDFLHTKHNLLALLGQERYKNRTCSVSLVHGYLKDDEMLGLYHHEKIKALINISHGEGFGLPMFEAAGAGLPIVTIGWGGQVDFLYVPEKVKGKRKKQLMPKFAEVEHNIAPVQEHAVWPGVIVKESSWAYADPASYKMKLREVYKNHAMFKKRATVLQKHIQENFTEEQMYKQFTDIVKEGLEIPDDTEVDQMYAELFG